MVTPRANQEAREVGRQRLSLGLQHLGKCRHWSPDADSGVEPKAVFDRTEAPYNYGLHPTAYTDSRPCFHAYPLLHQGVRRRRRDSPPRVVGGPVRCHPAGLQCDPGGNCAVGPQSSRPEGLVPSVRGSPAEGSLGNHAWSLGMNEVSRSGLSLRVDTPGSLSDDFAGSFATGPFGCSTRRSAAQLRAGSGKPGARSLLRPPGSRASLDTRVLGPKVLPDRSAVGPNRWLTARCCAAHGPLAVWVVDSLKAAN
jgi:hypothetical protein